MQDVRASLRLALSYLSRSDRRRLTLVAVVTAGVALLDLVGLVVIGVLTAALSGTLLENATVPDYVPSFIDPTDSRTMGMLAALAGLAFMTKSALSWRLNHRVLRFLARREAGVATALFDKVGLAPFISIRQQTTQAIIEGVRTGSQGLVMLLAQTIAAAAEVTLLVVVSCLLLFLNPVAFVLVGALFGMVFLITTRFTRHRVFQAAQRAATSAVETAEVLAEAIGLAREARIYHLHPTYRKRLVEAELRYTMRTAEVVSWQQLPRYVFESALVLSIALIGVVALTTSDQSTAAATIAVFLAASSRVMPSLVRLQNNVNGIRVAQGQVQLTEAIRALPDAPTGEALPLPPPRPPGAPTPPDGPPTVRLTRISFRYPGRDEPAIDDVSLCIPSGARVALVGGTGAGKSTLADLILGVLQPDTGQVELLTRNGTKRKFSVGFVAQDVYLTAASIAENVALGVPSELIDERLVAEVLDQSQMTDVVAAQPQGIWTPVGERGVRLSGGQRQRLGIARALYRRPELLVFDEATSALDAITEAELTAVLRRLSPHITIVVVAHRLATVRDADLVVLLERGRVVDIGRFYELVERRADFALAASLQGVA